MAVTNSPCHLFPFRFIFFSFSLPPPVVFRFPANLTFIPLLGFILDSIFPILFLAEHFFFHPPLFVMSFLMIFDHFPGVSFRGSLTNERKTIENPWELFFRNGPAGVILRNSFALTAVPPVSQRVRFLSVKS